ncbi:tyrosine-type recombinase/integrase [Subtercola sp. RTI3]|uniref:tyrosine-type recombinase/integrase n=1 Tax=Subtercola sp. RTI3 TaxID=3048639 RepID=UPI002B22491E|nr:tyrosine-type recombinase/integrase [Subtercola sp. RTI3]MEA9984939.1 tyrosine-type recombinase/integrase [Subtercola sp. RTI3]
MSEVFERYHALILSKVSPGTGRSYMVAWRHRVLPYFGARQIESITTLDVELGFAEWSGSFSTRIDALSMLSAICKVAVKGGVITSNPCIGVDRPRVQQNDLTARSLTLEEVDRLLTILPAAGHYRRFVLALLYTGGRLGEIAGMRCSDVDIEDRTISIRRSASAGLHGEMVVGPTKGRRVRTVPLAEPLLPVILAARVGRQEHDLLFPGPRGGTINSKNLSRALDWFRIRDQIKTFPINEPALHWHDLRHTSAVMLFRAGVSAPDVQAILGHSSLAVTQMYANTRADAARRGAAALSQLYGNRQGHQTGVNSP